MENISLLVLHDDMLWKIMLSLPTKSLMKFKCVSKHCNKITRDPLFVKLYRCGFQSLLIFTPCGTGNRSRKYGTCFINTKDKQVEAYCPFPIQDQFPSSTNIVNGLIGFYLGFDFFKLCNIATGEFLDLPITSPAELLDLPSKYLTSFFLGFEPRREVYKVLRFINYAKRNGNGRCDYYIHLHICTLGRGGGCLEWRSLDPASLQGKHQQSQNICINGYLYMWGRTYNSSFKYIPRLLAIDLSSETVIEIAHPSSIIYSVKRSEKYSDRLVQLGGSLALINFNAATKMADVWILENQETWTKGKSIDLTGTPKNPGVYIGTLPTGEPLLTRPMLTKDGCTHPRSHPPSWTIYKYDHKQNKFLNWIQLVDVGVRCYSGILYYEHNLLALGSLMI